MITRTANASTLGYAAFAATLWMISMIHAGWFDPSQRIIVLMLAVTLGGSAMALAGILQFFRGHTIDMLLFISFAAFWWAWALNAHAANSGYIAPTAGFMGWYDAVWAAVAFCVWLAALRGQAGRMLFSLGLWLSMLALAIAGWTRLDVFTIIGGYLGLITAVIGIYMAAAEAVNDARGYTVLPTGEIHHMEGTSHPEASETLHHV